MHISTEIESLRGLGVYEKRLDAMKEAGFDAYDFSMFNETLCGWLHDADYAKKAAALRAYADSIGLPCNQTHAPAPLVFIGDEKRTEERFHEIVRALEITHILGGKLSVVHPWNGYSPEQNAQIYKRLEPYARQFGVKIALENMWFWDDAKDCACPAACSDENNFNAHLDLLDNDVFVALLDLGHAEMKGLNTSAVSMIKALGSRLEGMHIHDNDLKHDSHKLPFTMEIDYIPIIQALKEVDYRGDITLECLDFLTRLPKELLPTALKLMAETANWIRTQLSCG